MKLFAKTLTNHLQEICSPILTGQNDGRELRLFLSSFQPDIIYETGCQLNDFLATGPRQVDFIYKVGLRLWDNWKQSDTGLSDNLLSAFQDKEWIDTENRLTFYRNLKWDKNSGKDCLIIILIGVEQAIDRGSLKDFYFIDASDLWTRSLKRSFKPWIKEILHKNEIEPEKEHLEEINDLLKVLHKHGAGDLVRVSDFLGKTDFKGAQDGLDAMDALNGGLSYWDLPLLTDMKPRMKQTKYVEAAIKFFSYQGYLKESDRKKALNKIAAFEKRVEAGEEVVHIPEAFDDIGDLMTCLKTYIEKNTPESRNRLLKFDYAVVRDKILGFKEKSDKNGEKEPSVRDVNAPPLEAILTAVWRTLIDYKKKCRKIQPARALKEIRLEPIIFYHDSEEEQDGSDLLKGCLGGIDVFLEKNLLVECDIDGELGTIELRSSLLRENQVPLKKAGTKIPNFQFRVIIEADEDLGITRRYKWQLPETHAYRNFWNLARAARDELKNCGGPCLPVFSVPYYTEIFSAPDEEDATRILKLGLNNLKVINLLDAPGLNKHNPSWSRIKDLSSAFGDFLQHFAEDGYFEAVEKHWSNFFQKVKSALEPLAYGKAGDDEFAPLLYKAFLLTDLPCEQNAPNCYWDRFVNSAVVTGLHPALLEMLRHRETFLVHGFTDIVKHALEDSGREKINLQKWHDVCDLAIINYPLFGIISDTGKALNTQISSMGLIHRIGSPPISGATLSAKVLRGYEAPEDDNIKDSVLFRETRESKEIKRILLEFIKLHPHANDGLSVAVLNARDIQPIIAGIDIFLKQRLNKEVSKDSEDYPPYHFSITLFMHSDESREISRWLQEWRRRWEPLQIIEKFRYYQQCRLSVSQRVIGSRDDYANILSGDDFEADIAILSRFISAKETGDDVETAAPYKTDWSSLLKFPIVETPRCAEEHPSKKYYRARIVSNRQFRLASLHSDLSARFKHPNTYAEQQHIVISDGDYTPWIHIVDLLHQKASWVVCIDPSVDERLVGQSDNENQWKREIIGFSSGIGAHGELNYTVSTERSSISDIKKRIQEQINRIFGPWEPDELEKAAHLLVNRSRELAGLSLVRATGPNEYVRDLIAYALIRICLPPPESESLCLCDQIIGLDAFQHWFDGEDRHRPDLMRLITLLDKKGKVQITAQLIECKIAKKSTVHLEKARTQLENGLRHLIRLFRPRERDKDSRFDQKFWWAQLQRLIANKAVISSKYQRDVTTALEYLGNGYFEINWNAMAVTFWTDSEQNEFVCDTEWNFHEQDHDLNIAVVSCGKSLIRNICCKDESVVIPANMSDKAEPKDEEPVSFNIAEKEEAGSIREVNEDTENDVESASNSDDINSEYDTPNNTEQEAKVIMQIPESVFLGYTENAKREVCWEFGHSELPNRHILIFGKSGAGKTYAIQTILFELGLQKQNSVIVDYTNGFLPDHLEPEFKSSINPKTHLVRQDPLPINPFRRQQQIIQGFDPIVEDAYTVGGRITSVFTSVYSSIGEQQRAVLTKTIAHGLDKYGSNFNFDMLLEQLENQGNTAAFTLANKLGPLVRSRIFSAEDVSSWRIFYNDTEHRINIMQLTGVPREISQMATEFVLWDLYDFAKDNGRKDIPLPIVLDEIQNLDHQLDAPLAKILTEGRKFGLSLILATQTLSNLKAEERDRLFQASHKLFFKPADTEVQEYGKILERSTNEKSDVWIRRLTSLNKGECYSLGSSLNAKTGKLEDKAFRIKITSLEERIQRIKS